MKNFKNNFKRNRFRSNSDRNYKRNGSNKPFNANFNEVIDYKRNKNIRNYNPSKLIEKYTELAKEALSNGDKILSENYLQHADHFIRINEKKNEDRKASEVFNNQSGIEGSNDEKDNKEIDLK